MAQHNPAFLRRGSTTSTICSASARKSIGSAMYRTPVCSARLSNATKESDQFGRTDKDKVRFHADSRDSGFSTSAGMPVHATSNVALEESLLQDARWDSDRLLRFMDYRLEAMFTAELNRKRHRTVLILFIVGFCFGWFEFFCYGGYQYLRYSKDEDVVGLVVALARLLLLGTILIALMLQSLKVWTVERSCIFVCYLAPPIAFFMHEYRMSVLFGFLDFWETHGKRCGAETCTDDTDLLVFLIFVCSVPLLCSVRLAKVLFLLPYNVILYIAFSWSGLGPNNKLMHGIHVALFIAQVVMLLVGCYRIEADMRHRWLENLMLRVKVQVQRIHLRRQHRRSQELEKQLLATHDPDDDGIFDASCDDDEAFAIRGHRLLPRPGEQKEVEEGDKTVPVPLVPLILPSSRPEDVGNVRKSDLIPSSSSRMRTASEAGSAAAPNALLVEAMAGRTLDMRRLQRMSERILDYSYTLAEFFEDSVAAFPELSLFFVEPATTASSGLSGEVEYQRTVGALFAVFWLCRLQCDGKHGFCYGYDKEWVPYDNSANVVGEGPYQRQKRDRFLKEMEWEYIEKVKCEALGDSLERLQAMLCLTAFHDIMKVPALCPTVAPEHAPYEGYAAGERISDHDLALAYVLDKYPDLLPSFRELPRESKEIILFTQGKMHFNHGWFVQAEATPGAMLSKFKAVLSKSTSADLAFYFLHWLTDLSGAEGRPLAGAEKFVLRFPRAVLSSFLWSIPFLQKLAIPNATETSVVQQYLEARFKAAVPEEPLPSGVEAVAILRLVVMAQASGPVARDVFPTLPIQVRQTLAVELARTGVRTQRFSHNQPTGGPALFVYYGPALLQNATSPEEMARALLTLAAVYRAGRCLWPLAFEEEDSTVRLEAGSLKAFAKEILAENVNNAMVFVERLSDVDGIVKLVAGHEVNELLLRRPNMRALEMREEDWNQTSALPRWRLDCFEVTPAVWRMPAAML